MLRNILRDFSRTQSLDFYSQLRSGVRFFDLRVSKLADHQKDARFWTVHGQMACIPLEKFFDDINRFHRENGTARGDKKVAPVVTVVRTFRLTQNDLENLRDEFKVCLEHDHFTECANALRTTPIDQLPPNVVVGVPGLCQLDDYRMFAADDWIDTYCPKTKLEGLRRQVCLLARPRFQRNNLYILGFTVTPHFWDVFTRIVTFGFLRPSVKDSASVMNQHFRAFLNEHRSFMKERVNVIFFDFFTKAQAAFVQELNDPAET